MSYDSDELTVSPVGTREARAELDAAVEELCEHLDLSGEIRKARMLGKRVRELMKKAGK